MEEEDPLSQFVSGVMRDQLPSMLQEQCGPTEGELELALLSTCSVKGICLSFPVLRREVRGI